MRNRAASGVAQAHLRALVSRLRGCLSALSSQQQRLLSLRAGLNGTPAGTGAVARILHIGPQREALLERLSLVALRSAAVSGCAGSQAGSSPTLTSAANAAGAGGQLVSAVAYLPNASAAAAAGHAGSGTGKVSAGSAGAAPGSSSPGSTARPATLAAAGIQRAAVTSTQSPALTLVVLMLLLGVVVLLKPWRRRSLVAHRTAAPQAAPVSRATPMAPAPVSPEAPMAPAPVSPEAPMAPATVSPEAPMAPTTVSRAAPATSSLVSRWTPAATASAPPARPGRTPARPARTPARPAPAAPTANSARRPDPGRASREPGWLRDHAAQGALVATAVAGVIARGLARRSGTGRRR